VTGAFCRGLIASVTHTVVEEVVTLLGWRNRPILPSRVAKGATVFCLASLRVLT